ncbi:MAG TPA: sulfite exporter TauE/SafE family protein [Burkholderiaceae bacterium]|nr:sulfite exporter TauE/SafE family protein [Burkholderiaceae bacterium]
MLDQILLLQPLLVIELLALGIVAGFLAGLLGIGGGMLMVPFLTWILNAKGFAPDITLKMAVATSLTTICFTSLSSVRAHHKRGAVLWPIAWAFAPGILLGSFIGAQFAAALPTKLLSVFFSVFIAYSALQMFLNKKPKPTRVLPQPMGMFGVGGLIGLLSSLVGAGGAFISVPFMTWCNVPIHKAVATSAALGFPIALAGTLGYIWAGLSLTNVPPGAIGYVYLPAVIVISIASVSLAPLGAQTAHRIDIAPLKKVFASFLLLLALSFLFH